MKKINKKAIGMTVIGFLLIALAGLVVSLIITGKAQQTIVDSFYGFLSC